MPLSNPNTYINTLVQAGSDAMSNLYYLRFSGGILDDSFSDMPIALKVRTGNISLPTASQGKAAKNYMTVSVDMPNSALTINKQLSFPVRLDEDYRVYKYLLLQQSVTSVGGLGYANTNVPDDAGNGFKISVYVFDKNVDGAEPCDQDTYTKIYEFRRCWIKHLDGLNYSYDSSSPMTINCTVNFQEYDDPMNLL